MKILVTDIKEQWQQDFLAKALPNHKLIMSGDSLNDLDLSKYSDVEGLSVFITSRVNADEFAALPNLKFITTRSTGFDHIDRQIAKERGVVVANVPAYGENTVAEHAFALLLALSRKLHESFNRIKEGHFDYHGLRGWDIKGKTVGIIGGGHIGIHFAKMAKGFNMNVLVFDIYPKKELADLVGFKYVDLDELYASSDVISLHLPLNEHTKYIINKDSIAKMKDGVYIINTARGALIKTDDLIKALKDRKIAGAGLDVLEGENLLSEELDLLGNEDSKEHLETLLANHILMDMDNVVITPHNAFNSVEAVERILTTTIENINAFASGSSQNTVEA